jgi:hypothetical protein
MLPALLKTTHALSRQIVRSEMPLYPFLPVIVWMGLVQVMLDGTNAFSERTATQRTPDPEYLLTNRDNVIAFPAVAY